VRRLRRIERPRLAVAVAVAASTAAIAALDSRRAEVVALVAAGAGAATRLRFSGYLGAAIIVLAASVLLAAGQSGGR
jgi:hypothetical protein